MEYFARRRARSSTSFPETQATKLERSITLDAHLMQYSKGSEGIAINNFWQALPPAAVVVSGWHSVADGGVPSEAPYPGPSSSLRTSDVSFWVADRQRTMIVGEWGAEPSVGPTHKR